MFEFGELVEASVPAESFVFSIGHKPGRWGRATRIPAATEGFGVKVVDVAGDGPVWGWTPPGDLRAAERYSGRLVANIEYRPVVPARPASGWVGNELASAAALAPHVLGVVSHGYVPRPLGAVFETLARAGAIGFPEVFDPDRSTDPRVFLRTCLASWRKHGFGQLVPVFGAAAGVDFLREGLDEAARLGLAAAIWTSGSMAEQGIAPADVGLESLGPPGPRPAPGPRPGPRPGPAPGPVTRPNLDPWSRGPYLSSSSTWASTSTGGELGWLFALGAGLYFLGSRRDV